MKIQLAKSGKFLYSKILDVPEISVILPFVILWVIAIVNDPTFISSGNLIGITKLMATYGFLALGEAFIITTGEIDISIGSMTAFASCFCAFLMNSHGIYWPFAILLTLALTMSLSLISSLLIVKMGMHSFITTIAMLYVCKGGARVLENANAIAINKLENARGLIDIFSTKIGGIGIGFIVLVLFYVVGYILLTRTVYGRKVQATGDSLPAARLSGINTDRIKISVYLMSGFMVTVTSIFLLATLGSANPNTGDGWEMSIIAACAIGGISMSGGFCSIIGIFFGLGFMTSMQNVFSLFSINANLQKVILGAVIIAAVIMDAIRRRRKYGSSI